jgi:hypothetical protein
MGDSLWAATGNVGIVRPQNTLPQMAREMTPCLDEPVFKLGVIVKLRNDTGSAFATVDSMNA